jgi:glycosyltransferase involved in cell wall biosynthesis
MLTNISTSDMVQLLSSSIALVFATLGEGFGLPVIEAMKCGCPVITSSTTSLPEVGGDAALYVDPISIDEISYAMQRCIDDTTLRQSMRERGFLQAATFTWEATALATVQVYRSVIDAYA